MSNQVYGYITDKIMEELERGCVPWHKPWKSPDGVRVPINYFSKKPYRGVNTFLLAVSRFKAGYDSNYWLTFKQIQALGGNVKGQHSEMVVFWKLLEKPAENPTAENETDYIPMLRYYRVFNLDQVTGIKKPSLENLPTSDQRGGRSRGKVSRTNRGNTRRFTGVLSAVQRLDTDASQRKLRRSRGVLLDIVP